MSAGTAAPTPSAPSAPAGADPGITALTDALAAEHAALFAYPPIGVRLDGALADAAREAEATHRQRRDELVRILAEAGVAVPPPEAGYQLPFPVTDPDAALELAVLVEERVAGVWRAVLRDTSGIARAEALDALVDAAVRATGWRAAAGIDPATVAFPGAPA